MERGVASAFSARTDGEFFVMVDDKPSAAGIGLYLSVEKPLDVAITPMGSYSGGGFAGEDSPSLRSTGGLAITVYAGEASPAFSRKVSLWDVHGARLLEGFNVKGQIADAASPASGFGSVRLAPLIMRMDPGVRYLVSGVGLDQ